MHQNCG
jgi:hypothetical protein